MSNNNSYAEFVLGFLKAQLTDCALQYPALTKEFSRDFKRLSSAIEHHGLSFPLVVMPSYRKHFDQCLAKGRLTRTSLVHFGPFEHGGTIPRLFRGLVLRVFDRSGVLRPKPDVEAVRWVRQLLGGARKIRLTSSVKHQSDAVRDFFRTDAAVAKGSLHWDNSDQFDEWLDHDVPELISFHQDASGFGPGCQELQMLSLLTEIEPPRPTVDTRLLECVQHVADYITSKLGVFDPMQWGPKHGPGAVSDRQYGSDKYAFDNWPERLERTFPSADFAYANYAWANASSAEDSSARGWNREFPAKLCAVPKTLEKPRLIACESTSSQWCQQSLRHYFYSQVQTSNLSGFIDFRRQDRNGQAALRASMDGKHATIDLSSASDRISCWHVERLFRRSPTLLRALQSTRAVWIQQGICRISPRYYYLRKYSTMGNATTFPVQSLFFLSLALGTLLYARNLRISDRVVRELRKEGVLIYGDDIVVPTDCVGTLVELIQALGLKVNDSKTFSEGNFRESCGVDAFLGHNVTTVSVLDVPKKSSPGSVVSSVDVHNNLLERGMLETAAFIRKTVHSLGGAYRHIREVKHGSGLFGWSGLGGLTDNTMLTHRWNQQYQVREVRCLLPRGKEQRALAKDGPGMLQYFTEAPEIVTSASSTLGHLTRRPKAGLALGWAPAE